MQVPVMCKGFPVLLAFIALSVPAKASEVWQVKPIAEWTREETQEFFRDSPWVHQVVVANPALRPAPVSYPDPTGESQREPSSAEGIKVEPRFGANGETSRTVYYIEWTSAKIVRRAGAHYRALQGQGNEVLEQPDLHAYVLTVTGYDLTAFDGRTETELIEGAYLRSEEIKTKIRPTKAKLLRDNNGQVRAVRYTFPRDREGGFWISDREKSAKFVSKSGDLKLKTRFELSRMVTQGGRDL